MVLDSPLFHDSLKNFPDFFSDVDNLLTRFWHLFQNQKKSHELQLHHMMIDECGSEMATDAKADGEATPAPAAGTKTTGLSDDEADEQQVRP